MIVHQSCLGWVGEPVLQPREQRGRARHVMAGKIKWDRNEFPSAALLNLGSPAEKHCNHAYRIDESVG